MADEEEAGGSGADGGAWNCAERREAGVVVKVGRLG